MVSLFKERSAAGVFRLIILSIIVHAHFFVSAPVIDIPQHLILLKTIVSPLFQLPSILLALLYHAIIIVQALRLNYILGNNKLFPNTNFTTAMCYILFTALLPAWNNITAALIVNSFIIWILGLLIGLRHTNHSQSAIFNIGLLTGISVLLLPSAVALFLCVLIAILILRAFKINELFIYIVGSVLPYYFLGAALFYFDSSHRFLNYIPHFTIQLPTIYKDYSFWLMSAMLLFVAFLGFIYLQNKIGKLLITARKAWIIIILMIGLFIPTPFFIQNSGWSILLLLIPAVAALSANLFFYNKSKIFLSLLFWLFIFIVWFNNFDLIHYLFKIPV